MFARFSGLAALLAAGALVVGPAHAQPGAAGGDSDDELYCVYEAISMSDDFYTVAGAQVDNITEGDEFEEALAAIAPIVTDCYEEYDWDDVETEIALTMGVHGAASDLVLEMFEVAGVSDDELELLDTALIGVSDDDFDTFYKGEWRDDAAFKAKIIGKIKSAGFSNEDMMPYALVYMESYIVGLTKMDEWDEHRGK